MKSVLTCFGLLFTGLLYCQTYTVESVPNEKTNSGSYVSNPDGILSEASVSSIDQMLGALEQSSTAQVAVVVLNSIGEEDHVDFAQHLFELWGIGHADNDNGLLILFILDQRKIRFHTGFGVEGILTDAVCKRIEMEYMVPDFKDENYDAGMLAGVERAAAFLNDPELISQDNGNSNNRELENPPPFVYVFMSIMWCGVMGAPFLFLQLSKGFKGQGRKVNGDIRMTRKQWAVVHMVVPIVMILTTIFFFGLGDGYPFLAILIGYLLFLAFFKYSRIEKTASALYKANEYQRIYNLFQDYQTTFLVTAILIPPMWIFFIFYLKKKKSYRNHPRACTKCGSMAVKLNEKADDSFLKEGEVFEEKLGSIDYDIWECGSCKSIEKLTYASRSAKYSDCPHCETKALHSISRRTIDSPSYSSSGKGEEIEQCKFCQLKVISSYSIPKLTRSSSSSSSSGGGGSSFGGGSSGGGGSSSSW
jgi:uncharacterized protein